MDVIIILVIVFCIIVSLIVITPAIKYAIDIAPYLYANTRCSAKSGVLIDNKRYEGMLTAGSLNEILGLLEDTTYNYAVEHQHDFFKLSGLLENDLHDNYLWLQDVVPDKVKDIVFTIKKRFEINQIKAALNEIREGRQIQELPHIGDANLRLKLESSNDLNGFLASLEGTEYEEFFNGKGIDDMQEINTKLDFYYINCVKRSIDKCDDTNAALPFREYWKVIIDITNLRLTFRRLNSKSADIALVPGGNISTKDLMNCTDINQLEGIIQKTDYKEFMPEINESGVEIGLYKFLKKKSGVVDAKYPIKSGPVIKFLINKELEIRNLNILLKLKAENFAGDIISKYMVM